MLNTDEVNAAKDKLDEFFNINQIKAVGNLFERRYCTSILMFQQKNG